MEQKEIEIGNVTMTDEKAERLKEYIKTESAKQSPRRKRRNVYLGIKYRLQDKIFFLRRILYSYLPVFLTMGILNFFVGVIYSIWIMPIISMLILFASIAITVKRREERPEKMMKASLEALDKNLASMTPEQIEELKQEFFPDNGPIKVRITGCDNPFAWYSKIVNSKEDSDKIFEVEEVEENHNLLRTLKDVSGPGVKGFISVHDVEYL